MPCAVWHKITRKSKQRLLNHFFLEIPDYKLPEILCVFVVQRTSAAERALIELPVQLTDLRTVVVRQNPSGLAFLKHFCELLMVKATGGVIVLRLEVRRIKIEKRIRLVIPVEQY